MILAWSGSPSDVPIGWALCDGNNGTPDLRGRFILGASSSHVLGQTGGEEAHVLTWAEMPAHSHSGITSVNGEHTHQYTWATPERPWDGDYAIAEAGKFGTHRMYHTDSTTSSGAHNHSLITDSQGGSQAHNNMPPFYALAYIMRII